MIDVHTTGDVEEYAAAAGAFLEADPCARNVLLTVIDTVRTASGAYSAAPSFWWVTDSGSVVGAASWTPPHNLLVSSLPEEAESPLPPVSFASGPCTRPPSIATMDTRGASPTR